MKVYYDEGVTTRIGPKPCIAGREARGEASAGDRIGQPLSHDMNILDADAVEIAEGNMDRRDSVSAPASRPARKPGQDYERLAEEVNVVGRVVWVAKRL